MVTLETTSAPTPPLGDGRALICRAGDRVCALPLVHVVETMRPQPIEPVSGALAPVPADLGAKCCVRKPVDFRRFIDAARQLGLYWLVTNELPAEGGA